MNQIPPTIVGKNKLHVLQLIIWMMALLYAIPALAVAPANSLITNTASMTYTGLTTPIQASVDVKVALVTAAPNLTLNTANITVAENQLGVLTYTITANANGPDNYTIGTPANIPANVTTNGAASASAGFIALGATAVGAAAMAGSNQLIVPADGVADGVVNGIAAGDTLVIAGQTYTVATVTDNPTGNSTIILTTNLLANITVGTLIAEQATFNVSQQMGTVIGGVAQGANDITLTATSSGGQVSATATGIITVLRVSFQKLVSVAGGAFTNVTPTVASGDVLTYRLIASIPVGSTINGVMLRDTIPLFTTYVLGSTTLDSDGPNIVVNAPAAVADVLNTTPLAQAAGMAVNSTGQAAGTIAAAGAAIAEVSVEFQVTVD
ncbi:MAG: hypothetical protein R8K21_00065 [Mariprofundales bacterium]